MKNGCEIDPLSGKETCCTMNPDGTFTCDEKNARGKWLDRLDAAFSSSRQWAWLFVIAYVLNYFWETWQLSFFTGTFVYSVPWAIKNMPFIPLVIWDVSIAVLFDASLIIFGCMLVVLARGPSWLARASMASIIFVTVFCVATSIIAERIGISQGWWAYTSMMPVIPILDVGLIPILAFVITPLMAILLSRKMK